MTIVVAALGCDVEGSIGLGSPPIQPSWVDLDVTPHHEVDLLFVIDNTAGMKPKQQALAAALDAFANQLQGTFPRQFHFGVVTTDLGAGKAAGQCVVPGGDGLLLDIGTGAPDGCRGPTGTRWLDWGVNGNNLPPGQGLAQTLGCMVQAGSTGCGFPQPLEAVARAIANPANSGFLRSGSLLVILFVSDGDDCSAPPESEIFDPAAALGPFDRSRCVNAGVECGNPPHPPMPDPNGPLEGCVPRSGGDLYDLDRYRQLLFLSTGVKPNPNDVQVGLLAGPASPFSVALDGSGNLQLQPSCVNADDNSYTALPALRLQSLVRASPRSVIANLCTAGASQYFLGGVGAELIANDPGAACLPAPLADTTQPMCQVAEGNTYIPDCVSSGNANPCWELTTATSCLPVYDPRIDQYQQLAMMVRPAPAGLDVSARCLVIPFRK